MNSKFLTAAALSALMVTGANAQTSNEKIKVIHKGKMIEVSSSAVPAHIAHGDQLFANPPAPTGPPTGPPAPTAPPYPPAPTAAPAPPM